jgi:flagellar biosynthesis/type III secretory pathway protein FliH
LSAEPVEILRDVAVDTRVHVLARPMAAPTAKPPVRDEAVELAFERGLAEGLSQAAQLAGEEIDRVTAQRVREQVAAALAEMGESARLEGLQAGMAEARRVMEAERAAAAARIEAVLAAIAASTRDWMYASEDELVLLAHEIACRVVAEAAVRPEAIRLLVRRLLDERTGGASDEALMLQVHVHPEDFAAFAAGESPNELGKDWRWVSDDSIALGGVRLRSPRGSFDGRLETQFAALADLLRETRARRDGGVE